MNPGTGKESNRLTSFSEISWGAATTLYMASITTINEVDMGHIVSEAIAIGRHSRDESTEGAIDYNDARANLLDGSDDGSASEGLASEHTVASSVDNHRAPSLTPAPLRPGHRARPPRGSPPPALKRPSSNSSRPASSVPAALRPNTAAPAAARRTVKAAASRSTSSSSLQTLSDSDADVTMTQSQQPSSHRRRAQPKAARSDEVESADDNEVEVIEVAPARVSRKASGSKKLHCARTESPAY